LNTLQIWLLCEQVELECQIIIPVEDGIIYISTPKKDMEHIPY